MAKWKGMSPEEWTALTRKRLEATFRNAVQALAMDASKTIPLGGRVPAVTSNLARSVQIAKVPIKQGGPNQKYVAQDLGIAAANLKLGDKAYVGYQANYAKRMNYGFVGVDSLGRNYSAETPVGPTGYRNASGFGFAEAAAAKWPSIVRAEALKISVSKAPRNG